MTLEFRREPTKGTVIVIANERSNRPMVFKGAHVTCPFDKGVESLTPPTKLALPTRKNWRVRAFDNAFAFLKPRGKYKPPRNGGEWVSPAYGEHEVIVESDDHAKLFQEFDSEQLALIFKAYVTRLSAIGRRRGIEYAYLFKNHGLKGGASIEHEHSQAVGLPFVPPVIAAEAEANRKAGCCIHCKMLKTEKPRMLAENAFFTAFCPQASRMPFETWIVAKRHVGHMAGFTDAEAKAFMEMLRYCIDRVYRISHDYNVFFHNSPGKGKLHFHAEICPRSNVWAGMELGAGVIINGKTADEALAALKAV